MDNPEINCTLNTLFNAVAVGQVFCMSCHGYVYRRDHDG